MNKLKPLIIIESQIAKRIPGKLFKLLYTKNGTEEDKVVYAKWQTDESKTLISEDKHLLAKILIKI